MQALKDCPSRTADAGYGPGETYHEPETISDAAATDVIVEALTSKRGAYGMTHDDLYTLLTDMIFNADERDIINMIFAARNNALVGKSCGLIANEYSEVEP